MVTFSSTNHLFKMMFIGSENKRAEEKEPDTMPMFAPGDYIRLKGENPYKGTLKCGVPYLVLVCGHTMVLIDYGTNKGAFRPHNFERCNAPSPTEAGAQEYDEIMQAKSIME